jgi:protein SCO1/2
MGRTATYSRTIQRYALPNVRLVDQDGVERALSEVAGPGRTVAVNFIFATCTTICPVMTATFARMRRELGSEADDLQMISISIDPEHDTPSVLASYAEPFGADDGWRFLTGELEEVVAVERAFDAYSGNKMSHRPLWFFRGPAGDEWVRIDGLASGTALADEYRRLSGR